MKTRYLSSDYKKPLCIELEDVKINQSFEVDLEAQARRKHSKEDECKVLTNGSENVVAKRTKYFFEKALNNLLQYLPPTAMILAQVKLKTFPMENNENLTQGFSFQFLGIRIKNFSTTVLNKEKGPLASLNVPNLELTFDGCVVKNSRTLFIALALQHIRVSPITFEHNGRRQYFESSALSSRSFLLSINKILQANPINHVWQK